LVGWLFPWASAASHGCRVRLKRDGTPAETRFGLSEKRTSPIKTARESVQSSTGSRGERISGQRLYWLDRPCSEVHWKSTAYPLHSPVSPSLPPPVRHRVPSRSKRILLQPSWLFVPPALDVPTLATRCPRAYRRVPHSSDRSWNLWAGNKDGSFSLNADFHGTF
jgi:hypothetical protein